MNKSTALGVGLSLAFAALLATALPAPACAASGTEAADSAYDMQHYSDALALYERAAAEGDRRAQEMAGLMLFCGDTLYGDAVPRDKQRAAQWLAMAAAQGSPMAADLLQHMQTVARR